MASLVAEAAAAAAAHQNQPYGPALAKVHVLGALRGALRATAARLLLRYREMACTPEALIEARREGGPGRGRPVPVRHERHTESFAGRVPANVDGRAWDAAFTEATQSLAAMIAARIQSHYSTVFVWTIVDRSQWTCVGVPAYHISLDVHVYGATKTAAEARAMLKRE
jgi:hypothetical protein